MLIYISLLKLSYYAILWIQEAWCLNAVGSSCSYFKFKYFPWLTQHNWILDEMSTIGSNVSPPSTTEVEENHICSCRFACFIWRWINEWLKRALPACLPAYRLDLKAFATFKLYCAKGWLWWLMNKVVEWIAFCGFYDETLQLYLLERKLWFSWDMVCVKLSKHNNWLVVAVWLWPCDWLFFCLFFFNGMMVLV